MFYIWVRNETAEIHVLRSGLKTRKNRKTSKNAIRKQDSSARCQNEGPKNEIDKCTVRFVAAQLPTGSSSLPSLADRTALARRIVRG